MYFSSIPSVSLVSKMDPLPLAAEQTDFLKGSVKRSNPHSYEIPPPLGLTWDHIPQIKQLQENLLPKHSTALHVFPGVLKAL